MKSVLLPTGAFKFRENNADSVTFKLAGDTPEAPRTLTISRSLPTPRKGNAGTLKIFMNFRRTIPINDGTPDEKYVPMILKVETSIPVGATNNDVTVMLKQSLSDLILGDGQSLTTGDARDQSLIDTFVTGIIPDEKGDPTAE